MRVGVFLPNWIGDVVMATPTLRALRELVGESGELIGIMRPYVAEVLEGTTWLDAQILYEKPARLAEWALPTTRFARIRNWWALPTLRAASGETLQQLRSARLDCIVLLTNSLRTGWIAWRSGARERIGYVGQARSWLLTRRLRRPTGQPTIDAYLTLAAAAGPGRGQPTPHLTPNHNRSAVEERSGLGLGSGLRHLTPDAWRLELATTSADEQLADAVWRQLNLPPGAQVVILNSGGAYGAAKHWPAEHFAELAQRIVADHGLSVLVNCGPAERSIAREIVARAGSPRVVSLAECEQLPIGLTKACIRRARLVVTTDSGPRFLAVAFDRPVLTLFGPTNPAATATHYDGERCLSLSLDCQPCMRRTCPLGHHRCMRELSVQRVYHEVERALQASGTRRRRASAPNSTLQLTPNHNRSHFE